jgi:hypothetical protein
MLRGWDLQETTVRSGGKAKYQIFIKVLADLMLLQRYIETVDPHDETDLSSASGKVDTSF